MEQQPPGRTEEAGKASRAEWSGRTWALVLGGGAGCFLLLVLAACGTGLIFFAYSGGPRPMKLVGSWKGRFLLPGESGPRDVIYTLSLNGRFRQHSYAPDGRETFGDDDGRWSFQNGELSLHWWDEDHYERGTVNWIDADSFRYRITAQEDPRQVGVAATFRRQ